MVARDTTAASWVHRSYTMLSDHSLGYGVEREAPAHPLPPGGDGHAAWDYPEDLDVAHDLEEVEIG